MNKRTKYTYLIHNKQCMQTKLSNLFLDGFHKRYMCISLWFHLNAIQTVSKIRCISQYVVISYLMTFIDKHIKERSKSVKVEICIFIIFFFAIIFKFGASIEI